MAEFSVKLEGMDALVKKLNELGNAPRLAARALNQTATHVRSQAVKEVTSQWNIKAKDIRDKIKIRGRATASSPIATLEMRAEPIPLIRFGAKQLKRGGVRYKLRKAAGFKRLPHAFVAKMRSGHVGVFQRRGKPRLPIMEKTVITPVSMLKQRMPELIADAKPFLRRRIESQIKQILESR